ncbi:hypothetical protein VFMJ11_A0679 [Aliivibrio fischeri MJ11]|uniref:Uncharacterized protein n=1 Tax=Aliivibrio fischeri (strain MJ11) TaxID=388396 RepID=B5EU60_ALIFM|nr:hypothetical protein [Aliivibrio fischeri]ACH63381.1 hypothetical protein VFMJ11_A0679 [Aliivibrio fischeri MJ11]
MENKNSFKNPKVVSAHIWIFTSFAASSMAFFLALFSGVDRLESNGALQMSANLFAMSLVFNSTLAIVVSLFERKPKQLNKLNQSKFFGWVFTIGTLSFLGATISLLFSFSSKVGYVGLVSVLVICLLLWFTNREFSK